MKKKSLSSLTPSAKNPRKITAKKLEMLRESMARYGDLSGIVVNQDGTLIGGHQRIAAFDSEKNVADAITITQIFNPQSTSGTTASGFIVLGGEQFVYREVDWSATKAKAAMLAANHQAGSWDFPLVSEMMRDLEAVGMDLDATMFSLPEREGLLGGMHGSEPGGGSDAGEVGLDGQAGSSLAEDSPLCTMTFTVSREQEALISEKLEAAKGLGPFQETGNSNANGNALARLAEFFHG